MSTDGVPQAAKSDRISTCDAPRAPAIAGFDRDDRGYQGIGLQIAKDLVAHGFTVLVGSRDPERGETAAGEIGPDAHALQLDVTDPASVAAAATRVRSEFGRLDVCQAMLPLLRETPGARIVNVSSGVGSLTNNSDPAFAW